MSGCTRFSTVTTRNLSGSRQMQRERKEVRSFPIHQDSGRTSGFCRRRWHCAQTVATLPTSAQPANLNPRAEGQGSLPEGPSGEVLRARQCLRCCVGSKNAGNRCMNSKKEGLKCNGVQPQPVSLDEQVLDKLSECTQRIFPMPWRVHS